MAQFYERLFELQRVRENGEYSIWLSLGSGVLMLERRGVEEPSPARDSMEFMAFHAPLGVSPEEFEERVETHGGTIEDRTQFTLYIRDPEGRRVGISYYPLPELAPSQQTVSS